VAKRHAQHGSARRTREYRARLAAACVPEADDVDLAIVASLVSERSRIKGMSQDPGDLSEPDRAVMRLWMRLIDGAVADLASRGFVVDSARKLVFRRLKRAPKHWPRIPPQRREVDTP
jgi:hypothetical protein